MNSSGSVEGHSDDGFGVLPQIQSLEGDADADRITSAAATVPIPIPSTPRTEPLRSSINPRVASKRQLRSILIQHKVGVAELRPFEGPGSLTHGELVALFEQHVGQEDQAMQTIETYEAEDTPQVSEQSPSTQPKYSSLREAILGASDFTAANTIALDFRREVRRENQEVSSFQKETVRFDITNNAVIVDWGKPRRPVCGTTVFNANEIEARAMANDLLKEYKRLHGLEEDEYEITLDSTQVVSPWEDSTLSAFGPHHF